MLFVREREDKDPLPVASVMSLHSQRGQELQQTHLKLLDVAADALEKSPDDVLDLNGHSYADSANIHWLDQPDMSRETMDDGNVIAVVKNQGGRSAWEIVKGSNSVGNGADRCLSRCPRRCVCVR